MLIRAAFEGSALVAMIGVLHTLILALMVGITVFRKLVSRIRPLSTAVEN